MLIRDMLYSLTVIQTEPTCLSLVLYLFGCGYVTHPAILKWLNQSNMNGYSYLKRMLKSLTKICAFVKKDLIATILFLRIPLPLPEAFSLRALWFRYMFHTF